jgi:hypothetical protein
MLFMRSTFLDALKEFTEDARFDRGTGSTHRQAVTPPTETHYPKLENISVDYAT